MLMFGWDFLLMLSRDSEDEMWSRFVFELVIWPQGVTLVRWTQPSGPLCLWQCFQQRCTWSSLCNFSFQMYCNGCSFSSWWSGAIFHRSILQPSEDDTYSELMQLLRESSPLRQCCAVYIMNIYGYRIITKYCKDVVEKEEGLQCDGATIEVFGSISTTNNVAYIY